MQANFSFDFGHRFISVGNWPVAFLIFSEDNVYTPDPAALEIEHHPQGMWIRASRYAWAGLQQQVQGTFEAQITYRADGFDCNVKATLPERIKGSALVLRQSSLPVKVPTRDYDEVPCPTGGVLLRYPSSLRFPVFPLREADGMFTCVASLDVELRGKSVAVLPDGDQAVIELHHYEDARKWSTHHIAPTWRVARTADPAPLFEQRLQIAREHWGLQPWSTRCDVPVWAREVGLVLNLHGMHWTGHLFNSYDQQLEIIRHVAHRMPGRHVLAYLNAACGDDILPPVSETLDGVLDQIRQGQDDQASRDAKMDGGHIVNVDRDR